VSDAPQRKATLNRGGWLGVFLCFFVWLHPLLTEYPWVDNTSTRERHECASASAWGCGHSSVGQLSVPFMVSLRADFKLQRSSFPSISRSAYKQLLKACELYPNLCHETRRLVAQSPWFWLERTSKLAMFLQKCPDWSGCRSILLEAPCYGLIYCHASPTRTRYPSNWRAFHSSRVSPPVCLQVLRMFKIIRQHVEER